MAGNTTRRTKALASRYVIPNMLARLIMKLTHEM